ncbi:hypothetical protein JCM19237_4318 [Photobacterium aphoticum]|uniref:Lipoprotein n=1 Tax=Photobacterium aphoticum TaxID=754436 RepID=A0A090RBL4_9GAMM|nr:hypothetical protein JCM19237_4318 [Photobacterium aphoticum]
MMKQGLTLASVASIALLLSACGGGGGGGDSADGNTGGGNTGSVGATCEGSPTMTCAYGTDEITVNVFFSLSPDKKLEARASFISAAGALYPDLKERLEIHAGGEVYEGDIFSATQTTSFPQLPYGEQFYEVYWYRSDTQIATTTVEYLTGPTLITSPTHDGTDVVVMDWAAETYHTYDVDFISLTCQKPGLAGDIDHFDASSERFEDVLPGLELPLATEFNTSLNALQTTYDTCSLTADIVGQNSRTKPEDQPRALSIHSYSITPYEIELF